MERAVINVEVAIWREGRYLAVERGAGEDYGAGWLGFPGGGLEPGFDVQGALEETARREVKEEVGLDLAGPVVYVESHTFGTPGEEFVLDVVFLAQSVEGEAIHADPGEVASVAWLATTDFLTDARTQPWTRASLMLADRKRRDLGW